MKHLYANGRPMAQILGLTKPKIGEGEEELSRGGFLGCARNDVQGVRDVQVKNNLLSIPAQTSTSFVPYITSVSKQCLQPMVYGLRLITVLIFVLCLLNSALAQSRQGVGTAEGQGEVIPLTIGRKVPEGFWTREHLFYVNGDTIRKTLEEHKGKLLVLDFWMSSCTRCLLHQKEINYFKAEYPDDLAVIMVNSKQSKEGYHKILNYTKTDHFKRLGLDELVSIIEDDYLERLFVHYAYPTYIWINPMGRVQMQTFRNLLDRSYQAPFIDKKR